MIDIFQCKLLSLNAALRQYNLVVIFLSYLHLKFSEILEYDKISETETFLTVKESIIWKVRHCRIIYITNERRFTNQRFERLRSLDQ